MELHNGAYLLRSKTFKLNFFQIYGVSLNLHESEFLPPSGLINHLMKKCDYEYAEECVN